MDYQLTCPVCEATYDTPIKFCTECGCNLSQAQSVTITQPVRKDRLVDNLRSQVQGLGQKAQKVGCGIDIRECRQQGCCLQASRDGFTASPG